MKIFVATPVYDAKLQVESVQCLLAEQAIAAEAGDELIVSFLPSCSHPAMGRNQFAKDFLNSDCDRLVFLDSDITFEQGSIVKLAHMPVDFSGAAYRYKRAAECYPVVWLPGEKPLWLDENGLLEVAGLGGGFMCLSRNVFEAIQTTFPDRFYEHEGRRDYCFFEMPFKNGGLHGEDTYFCYLWTASGGKIYLDPEIALTHWDFRTPYPGHIGNWLKARIQQQEKPNAEISVVALPQDREGENNP